MKMFMNWLANTFAPKMNEICSRPWIAAVSSSMQKVIPFILTGSLIYFYNVFKSYICLTRIRSYCGLQFWFDILDSRFCCWTAMHGKIRETTIYYKLWNRGNCSILNVYIAAI